MTTTEALTQYVDMCNQTSQEPNEIEFLALVHLGVMPAWLEEPEDLIA